MKSQRRHDLQTNSLADNLAEIVEYIKAKSQTITLGIVAIFVVAGAVWYWQYSAASRRQEGWQRMLQLVATTAQEDPQYLDRLSDVAASYGDSKLRGMAYSQLGNELMGQVTFGNLSPEKAAEYRQRAQEAFNNALSASADQPETAAIARMGLGRIAADAGDLGLARQHYETVRDDARLQGSPYPSLADDQLKVLDRAGQLPPLAVSTQEAAAIVAPATQPDPAQAAPATQGE